MGALPLGHNHCHLAIGFKEKSEDVDIFCYYLPLGSSSSNTVVDLIPHYQEVMGSLPPRAGKDLI